jgi:pSer/pThr/pTyr-binding forkhead associated (FHA) protein
MAAATMLQNASINFAPVGQQQQHTLIANGSLRQRRTANAAETSAPVPAAASVQAGTVSSPPKPNRHQFSIVLGLTPLNDTFERKSLIIPFPPETLLLGRQVTSRNVPAPDNGFFDSRVLSRTHAEVFADYETGKVYIRDLKSSNGTFVNSLRIGSEKSESEPYEIHKDDTIEFGIDIAKEDGSGFAHKKVSAKVDQISYLPLQSGLKHQNPQRTQTDQPSGRLVNSNNTSGSGNHNTLTGGLEVRRPGNTTDSDALDVALFGDLDSSLDELSMTHARHTLSGQFMNTSTASAAALEKIVKTLVTEIHSTRVELAKISSITKLLKQIKTNQKNSKLLSERLPELEGYRNKVSSLTRQIQGMRTDASEQKTYTLSLESQIKELLKPLNNPPPVTVNPNEARLDEALRDLNATKQQLLQLKKSNDRFRHELAIQNWHSGLFTVLIWAIAVFAFGLSLMGLLNSI